MRRKRLRSVLVPFRAFSFHLSRACLGKLLSFFLYETSRNERRFLGGCFVRAVLIDPPALTAVLTAIYGSDDYLCAGCGGDFCLPGAVEYQNLHTDLGTGATAVARLNIIAYDVCLMLACCYVRTVLLA